MRRTFGNAADRADDTLDESRRLYRAATDVAKRLDDQKSCALTAIDIFTPSSEILRCKLKDYCERLILKDPISHARKIEELLWRRGFYDAVAAAKKLRRGGSWDEAEKALLSMHIQVGVGFYHHLILRLQQECGLDLNSIVDFAFPEPTAAKGKLGSTEAQQSALKIIHRSLVCLGDLARYKLDVDPSWDPMIATRYYKMAISVDPTIGMPHNQLGTLAGHKNHGIDAVYHYLRCILCSEPFEGADGNLKRVISTNFYAGRDKAPLQRCAARLFGLLHKWDNEASSIDKINEDCENLLTEIENCLTTEPPISLAPKDPKKADTIEELLQITRPDQPNILTEELVFKVASICLMSLSKLESKKSLHIQSAVAFILALLSKLVHITTVRIQEKLLQTSLILEKDLGDLSFINFTESVDLNDNKTQLNGNLNGNSKKSRNLLSKLRRPRKRMNSSDSESMSEPEDQENDSSSDDLASDITESDEDDNFVDFSDDDAENDEELTPNDENPQEIGENGRTSSNSSENNVLEGNSQKNGNSTNFALLAHLKKQNLNSKELLEILSEIKYLQSIKICFDWIQSHSGIVKFVSEEMRELLRKTALFLNLIKIDVEEIFKFWKKETGVLREAEDFGGYVERVALPEDVDLKGIDVLKVAHEKLDWKALKNVNLGRIEEVILRTQKLASFGDFLAEFESSGVKFDSRKKMFLVKVVEEKIEGNGVDEKNSNDIVDSSDNKRGLKIKRRNENKRENGEKNDEKRENVVNNEDKGKLMRHMGKLWLKAEVRALESRLKSKLMSAFLVPDHEALAKYTPLLKRLMYAKKFIIVIPSVVVSALDEVKRSSGKAREATRWLESQLRKGSRFLRAQRPHERLPLPYIKGPKTKDKEAWLFFQIVECCHYLTQQSNIGMSGDAAPPVVTLLTGIGAEDRKSATFSPDGLAKTAGINLEHIEAFHSKWKTSSKSHG